MLAPCRKAWPAAYCGGRPVVGWTSLASWNGRSRGASACHGANETHLLEAPLGTMYLVGPRSIDCVPGRGDVGLDANYGRLVVAVLDRHIQLGPRSPHVVDI